MILVIKLLLAVSLFAILSTTALAQAFNCPALPAASGNIVTVSSNSALNSAVNNSPAGTTILITPGTYSATFNINTNGLTIRSSTGNRDDVILDNDYSGGSIVNINGAENFTIADLTIKRSYFHLIHATGTAQNVKIYNVKFIDAREQFIKINNSGGAPHDGLIACSYFELTDAGRPNVSTAINGCYTGGIDNHDGDRWLVRDNTFKNIYCTNGGLAEHAVHMWDDAADSIVERNVIINCARGIGFGLGGNGHSGGEIKNNFICANNIPGSPSHDVGIGLENASNVFVAHNSILANSGGFNAPIDVRFSGTTGTIVNNLYTGNILFRNGGQATLQNNVNANVAVWQSPATCDLHLKDGAAGIGSVVDQAVNTSVSRDFDDQSRDANPDVGADELGIGNGNIAPNPPTNLEVSLNSS